MRPFLGMETAEKAEIVACLVAERKLRRIDAVIRRGEIVEPRIAVGIGDRTVEAAARTGIVRRENLRRREAVNRRQQRRRVGGQGVGQRFPVEIVVQQVELAGAFEERGDMQRGEDLAVERGVFVEPDGDDRSELPFEVRVAGREERDVEPAPAHAVGEVEGDLFPRAVARRRRGPGDCAEHRKTQAAQVHVIGRRRRPGGRDPPPPD